MAPSKHRTQVQDTVELLAKEDSEQWLFSWSSLGDESPTLDLRRRSRPARG